MKSTRNKFDNSPRWQTPNRQRVKWNLETERDDLRRSLDWYTNVLQEPKLSMKQFLQLARERNQISVRLDRVKKKLAEANVSAYDSQQLKDRVRQTVTLPMGVTL